MPIPSVLVHFLKAQNYYILYNKLQTRNAGYITLLWVMRSVARMSSFPVKFFSPRRWDRYACNDAEDVRALSRAAPAGAWSRDPQQTLLPGRRSSGWGNQEQRIQE